MKRLTEDGIVVARLPKSAKVKDKTAAPLQITAEQLIRVAKEREFEVIQAPPAQKITDQDELDDFRSRQRKIFEDDIRKNRSNIANWIKYAKWEAEQQEVPRARSVWERALDVDHRNVPIWIKYIELEIGHKQMSHARNLMDRAVGMLPRANQLWYKYVYMEEKLKNYAGCRQVFERWMAFEPHEQAWNAYINFEVRCKEHDLARNIFERYIIVHNDPENWIKYARFEERGGKVVQSRHIFERAVTYFEDYMTEKLLAAFGRFEERQREYERARAIYRYGLDALPEEECTEIYRLYGILEKKHGTTSSLESMICGKRRFQYEQAIKTDPYDYDSWFDLIRLVEAGNKTQEIREVYERAIANFPPIQEKRYWRRYLYLWINYAFFEELVTKDFERTRQIYKLMLEIIPHKKFTFAKAWLFFAKFLIRRGQIEEARLVLGTAIGKSPKDKLFRDYIDIEIQLGEVERCRKLYEKWLLLNPERSSTWTKFAELEIVLEEAERVRGVFELAIEQPRMDFPDVAWKAYIDYEISQSNSEKVRQLFDLLLEKTNHFKVWLAYAKFELSLREGEGSANDKALARTRAVYSRGFMALKYIKEQRRVLHRFWRKFESQFGDETEQKRVEMLLL